MVGAPLVATSANASGKVPAARPAELDPALLERVDAAVLCPPLPAGGDPSTVVRPLGGLRLEVLRHGAVPAAALKSAGFTLVRPRHPLP
jgi:L-threonylcarbamoyladenylate synthase